MYLSELYDSLWTISQVAHYRDGGTIEIAKKIPKKSQQLARMRWCGSEYCRKWTLYHKAFLKAEPRLKATKVAQRRRKFALQLNAFEVTIFKKNSAGKKLCFRPLRRSTKWAGWNSSVGVEPKSMRPERGDRTDKRDKYEDVGETRNGTQCHLSATLN